MHIIVENSRPSRDGANVRIQRIHGFARNQMDPFLMIDEIRSDNTKDYTGGFPPHPHRGIETLTYILHGGFRHTDSMGNEGRITSKGAQWMSAGRGVIHSEMPVQQEGLMHGFQLWINLPAKDKLKQPEYRDVPAESIPRVKFADAEIALLGGVFRIEGKPYQGALDRLAAHAAVADLSGKAEELVWDIPSGYSAAVYCYADSMQINDKRISRGQLATLAAGQEENRFVLRASRCGALLLSGMPLREPLAHYGPFVMNSEAEIQQAIADFQNGSLAHTPVLHSNNT